MTIYEKNEAVDLTPEQRRALKAAIDAEKKSRPEMRTAAMANKRNLFDELMDGVAAMKAHRTGKITLRSYKVEPRTLPQVKPKMIKQVRARFHCSRSVFARKLFTNERTLEKWEQGRAKPNAQAAALLLLAARYPDTFERLEQLANIGLVSRLRPKV